MPLPNDGYLLDEKKLSMHILQENDAYRNIQSFVLNFLVMYDYSTFMTANLVVAWIFFLAMSRGILSCSASYFELTLNVWVVDLTPDIFISPEANDDTKDLNNLGSDIISMAYLLITSLILWSIFLQVSPFSMMWPL